MVGVGAARRRRARSRASCSTARSPRASRARFPFGHAGREPDRRVRARAAASARRSAATRCGSLGTGPARRLHDVQHVGAREPPPRRGRRAARSASPTSLVSLALGVGRRVARAPARRRRCERGRPQADDLLRRARPRRRPLPRRRARSTSTRATQLQTSLVLRGVAGFGVKHHLRTDRLLTLSEDLPLVAVAVDTRARIEAALRRGRGAARSTAWSRSSAPAC